MDAQGIEVLHVAYGDAVVEAVAHHLVFYLFPPFERLLYQHLRGEREGFLGLCQQLLVVVAEAGAETAEGIGCTQDDREAELMGSTLHFFYSGTRLALDGLHTYRVEVLHEAVAVLGVDDGLHGGAQHLHAIALEHSSLKKLHAAVERGLTAEAQQDAIGALFLYDPLDKLGCHGLEIDRVGHILGGLHGSDVGIDEHGADAFFLESFQRLGTAIVELARLTDFQGATAQQQYFVDFLLHRHSIFTNSSNNHSVSVGPEQASG